VNTLRRRVIAGAALLACAAPLGVAQAQSASGDEVNRAVATNEQDGGRAFDFSWSLLRQRGGVVNQQNVANAAARCTGCRATAIAFQVVLASRSATVGSPHNQALAITDQCTSCVVYAGAGQFIRVVSDANNATFTDEGRATLADVRNDLRALEAQDLDVAALDAAVDAQKARVVQVLTDEVVTSGGDPVTYRTRVNRLTSDH
jgi:putative peptide zinc metalloprotease protein